MRTGYNNVTIEVYERFSPTLVYDLAGDLQRAIIDSFDTIHPGGLYGQASFYIPRDVTSSFLFRGGNRVVFRNGQKIVYEGEIININYRVGQGADQGIQINCVGYWGALLGRRTWDKRWADNRISEDVWRLMYSGVTNIAKDGSSMATPNSSGLTIIPDEREWKNGEVVVIQYQMPIGETVKKITGDYDFSELSKSLPKKVFFFDGATYTDITNAYDGDSTTTQNISMTTAGYLYVDIADGTMSGIQFDFGATVNANTATLTAEYPTEDTSGTVSWGALTITDGTSTGGKTWAQDGTVTFTRPGDIAEVTVNSSRGRWVRLIVSANLTANVVVNDIYITEQQVWKFSIYDSVNATDIVSATSTVFSGSLDTTLGTPTRTIQYRLTSLAKQTPISNAESSVFSNIIGVIVYSETSSINLTEIAKDVRAEAGSINSDESNIDSNTFSLVPFFTDGLETLASILERAASFGDSSYNQWACYLADSELAASPDGKPVLFVKQYPSLSDYDYAIRIDETNLQAPFELVTDYDNIVNWVAVKYHDAENDRDIIITPDDDSNLKDTTSITTYGERHLRDVLDGGNSSTIATNLGRKYLAAYKDPKFIVSSPVRVQGFIRAKNGNPVPSSQIQAGKRIRIENFLDDKASVSGAGLTFLISQVTYSDNDEVATISTGVQDNLAILLSRGAT